MWVARKIAQKCDGHKEVYRKWAGRKTIPARAASSVYGSSCLMLGIAALLVAARYVYVMFIDPMSAFDKPRTTTTPQDGRRAADGEARRNARAHAGAYAYALPRGAASRTGGSRFHEEQGQHTHAGLGRSPERDDEDSELYRMRTTISDSDVLMLATIDFEKKTVDLISVPRDIPTRPSIIRRDAGKSTPRSQRAAAPKATASNTP